MFGAVTARMAGTALLHVERDQLFASTYELTNSAAIDTLDWSALIGGSIVSDRSPDNGFDFFKPDWFLQVFDHAGAERFAAPFRSEMGAASNDRSLSSLRHSL